MSFVPVVRTVTEKLTGKTAVVQINTQDNPALTSRFGVRGIPVAMFLRNGRVVDQLAGVRSAEEMLACWRAARRSA